MDKKLLEQAKQAGSAEELLALAKENDVELSAEEAQAYFAHLHKSGELSDEELDSVAGGGCYNDEGWLVVTGAHSCSHYRCYYCNAKGPHTCKKGGIYRHGRCCSCYYNVSSNGDGQPGVRLCIYSANRKG